MERTAKNGSISLPGDDRPTLRPTLMQCTRQRERSLLSSQKLYSEVSIAFPSPLHDAAPVRGKISEPSLYFSKFQKQGLADALPDSTGQEGGKEAQQSPGLPTLARSSQESTFLNYFSTRLVGGRPIPHDDHAVSSHPLCGHFLATLGKSQTSLSLCRFEPPRMLAHLGGGPKLATSQGFDVAEVALPVCSQCQRESSYEQHLPDKSNNTKAEIKKLMWSSNGLPECPAKPMLLHEKARSAPCRRYPRWTKEEDDLLREAVGLEGHAWSMISSTFFLGRRTKSQCRQRWKNFLHPSISRAKFTTEEDDEILRARGAGMQWGEIALMLRNRTCDQVRDRFSNKLDPTLKRKEHWTSEEDKILMESQATLGNKWTLISRLLPGRSALAVKNRWYGGLASRTDLENVAKTVKSPPLYSKLAQDAISGVLNAEVEGIFLGATT